MFIRLGKNPDDLPIFQSYSNIPPHIYIYIYIVIDRERKRQEKERESKSVSDYNFL